MQIHTSLSPPLPGAPVNGPGIIGSAEPGFPGGPGLPRLPFLPNPPLAPLLPWEKELIHQAYTLSGLIFATTNFCKLNNITFCEYKLLQIIHSQIFCMS